MSLTSNIFPLNNDLCSQNKQQNKISTEVAQVYTTIDIEKIRNAKRQREAMGLKKRMDGAQMLQNKEQQKRVELNIMETELKDETKSTVEKVARSKKDFEHSVTDLKRSSIKMKAVASSIPNLVMQVNDLKHSLEHHKRDTHKARMTVAKLQRDVGALEDAFMNKKDINGVRENKYAIRFRVVHCDYSASRSHLIYPIERMNTHACR